ncbi:MAG: DUF1080 domain-containing protein [Dysgonamonadaceae bacterium]|jgi:hypothetical protein|nr:DUF1080 domain-containing protein [Dysgonamonadaceae bacterium]
MKNFSNILLLACLLTGCAQTKKEALFNGKDLSNWHFVVEDNRVPADRVFSVRDESILIQGTPVGYMYTQKKYGNCTLELEWRWVDEPTNSGIFLLITDPTSPFPKGIECQLHAGDAGDFVLLGGSDMAEYSQPEGQERPRFPAIKKRGESSEKPAGEWNKARILIRDGQVTVYINDVLQNTGTSSVKEGYIGLQSEGKSIAFRNITVTGMR